MPTIAPPAHTAQPCTPSVPPLSPITRRGRRPAVAAIPVALPVDVDDAAKLTPVGGET